MKDEKRTAADNLAKTMVALDLARARTDRVFSRARTGKMSPLESAFRIGSALEEEHAAWADYRAAVAAVEPPASVVGLREFVGMRSV